MKKSSLIIGLAITALICTGIFSACTKEEMLVSKENNLPKQKWNPDEGSYFILGADNAPYQYAIYQNEANENNLFAYIESVLEEQEEIENPGYFILTYKKEEFIYYGFLIETNSYYHFYIPNNQGIPPVNPDDGGGDGNMCFAMEYRYFNIKQEAKDFAKEKAKECKCKVSIIKRKGQWIVGWDDGQ